MARIVGSTINDSLKEWVDEQWTCPSNKNIYAVEQRDLNTVKKVRIGQGRDDTQVLAIDCPCGGHVYFTENGNKRLKPNHVYGP